MPRHDLRCTKCGLVKRDVFRRLPWPDTFRHLIADERGLRACGDFEITWTRPPDTGLPNADGDTVVYVNPRTGDVRYPGRNDEPMPWYSRRDGYVEQRFRTLRDLRSFCKRRGLVNQATDYNRNSACYDREHGFM